MDIAKFDARYPTPAHAAAAERWKRLPACDQARFDYFLGCRKRALRALKLLKTMTTDLTIANPWKWSIAELRSLNAAGAEANPRFCCGAIRSFDLKSVARRPAVSGVSDVLNDDQAVKACRQIALAVEAIKQGEP